MSPSSFEITATVLFVVAIIHTFTASKFKVLADNFHHGSFLHNFFHLLSEVEVVFGLWGAVLFILTAISSSYHEAVNYVDGLNFTEPLFVFAILIIASTKPILQLAQMAISWLSAFLPFNKATSFYIVALCLGPLLGSLITEPAAMTVTAILLYDHFYKDKPSSTFMYLTMGTLFVNVSIGGVLTNFAAPPVLMVANKWGWSNLHMLTNFGYKAVIAVVSSTLWAAFVLRDELDQMIDKHEVDVDHPSEIKVPFGIMIVHVIFLAFVVFNSHHVSIFMGALLFFIGFTVATKEFQEDLKIKDGLMVAFFLAGLITLGTPQGYWLQPLIQGMDKYVLYFGATGLTAITDNAALTYLGSLVNGLPDTAKYFLVAGAVTGGGLTVIANAPNPAGYGILKPAFKDGISAIKLFKGALSATVLAILAFTLLP